MASISRRAARECALKMLYSFSFHKEADPEELFPLVSEEAEIPFDDFAHSLFANTVSHMEELDEKIRSFAKGWKLERVSRMTLAILRLCTYELLFTELPAAIAINEAVELAKLYDGDDAPAFINGILNSIAKEKGEQ